MQDEHAGASQIPAAARKRGKPEVQIEEVPVEKTKPALKKRKKTKTVLAGEDAQGGGTDVVLHLSQVLKGVAARPGLSLDEVFKIAKMTCIDEGADMGSMSSKTVPDESLALQLQAQENELEQRRRIECASFACTCSLPCCNIDGLPLVDGFICAVRNVCTWQMLACVSRREQEERGRALADSVNDNINNNSKTQHAAVVAPDKIQMTAEAKLFGTPSQQKAVGSPQDAMLAPLSPGGQSDFDTQSVAGKWLNTQCSGVGGARCGCCLHLCCIGVVCTFVLALSMHGLAGGCWFALALSLALQLERTCADRHASSNGVMLRHAVGVCIYRVAH